jgi:hypothetical protein
MGLTLSSTYESMCPGCVCWLSKMVQPSRYALLRTVLARHSRYALLRKGCSQRMITSFQVILQLTAVTTHISERMCWACADAARPPAQAGASKLLACVKMTAAVAAPFTLLLFARSHLAFRHVRMRPAWCAAHCVVQWH